MGRAGLSDQTLAPLIERAFKRGKPAAVALVINSPGGSAVQSSLIAARIRRLAAETGRPVHAFVEDIAASGGYWLACAADEIWADESSILGSIGVIFAGFGFPALMKRHGIERRVVTAGKSKSLADPFLPEKAEDRRRLKALQGPIHAAFIAHVQRARGTKLKEGADLFNADVWTGGEAVTLGLADGIAHLVPKMQALYGAKVRFLDYSQKRSLWQRLTGSLASDLLADIETRGLWARYGL